VYPAKPSDDPTDPAEPVEPDGIVADLTGDDVVDAADRDYFLAALNTRAGETDFDPTLDYDQDDEITLRDYQVWFDVAFPAP
jgi:hypothetical protein